MTRRIVNRPLVVLALLGLAAAAGCTTGTPGTPGAPTTTSSAPPSTSSTSAPATSAAAADPLAHTDPCSLLDPSIISQNGLSKGVPQQDPGARSCRWDTPVSATPQYEIAIDIYDTAGLGDFNHEGFDISDYPVGRHQGQLVKENPGDVCVVDIGVTKTSRVSIAANTSTAQLEQGCVIAKATAVSVEQKLPVGSS
jgi:hypothetical protein